MAYLSFEEQGDFQYGFDSSAEPKCRIAPGESVVIETEDSYHNQITTDGDRRDRDAEPRSNPLSGPIYVEDAQPGDCLVVDINSIDPLRGYASTYVPTWWWFLGSLESRAVMDDFLETHSENVGSVLPVEGDTVRFSEEISLPYDPMIGTIGTAPGGYPIANGGGGTHGGNLDLPIVAPGSTVYLPVETEGGLLTLGDCHAMQGEGEILGVGGEMAAEVTITVHLIEGVQPRWPRVRTEDQIYAVSTATQYSTLAETVRLSYVLLAEWLFERGIPEDEAWRLCGLQGSLLLGNPHAVAAGIPRTLVPS